MTRASTSQQVRLPLDSSIESIKTSMNRVALESVRKMASGLTLLFSAFSFFDWYDIEPPARIPIVAFDVALVSIYLGIYLAARKGRISVRYANALGTLVCWLAIGNILTVIGLTQQHLLYTSYLGLAFLGGAAMIISRKWMILTVIVPIPVWAAIMHQTASHRDFSNGTFALLTAIMLSYVLFSTRRRVLLHMHLLRAFTSALIGQRSNQQIGVTVGRYAALLTESSAWTLQWSPGEAADEWLNGEGDLFSDAETRPLFCQLDEITCSALVRGRPIVYPLGDTRVVMAIPLNTTRGLSGVVWLAKRSFKQFDVAQRQLAETCSMQAVPAFESVSLVQEVERLATIDELTGIFNRRQFFFLGHRELARRSLQRTESVSVVMADIDHFKSINDRYGHHVGDLVLQEVAKRLQHGIRKTDILGRYGGEEFSLILTETTPDTARQVIERLRLAVACEPVKAGAHILSVTLSFGATLSSGSPEGLEETIIRADDALYRAKKAGRNRLEFAPRSIDSSC